MLYFHRQYFSQDIIKMIKWVKTNPLLCDKTEKTASSKNNKLKFIK